MSVFAKKAIPLECISAWLCVCLSEPPLPGPPGGGSERQIAACLLVRPGSGRVAGVTLNVMVAVVRAMGP